MVHGDLDGNRIGFPSLPMFFSEAVAFELDNRDCDTVLVKSLARYIVTGLIIEDNFVLFKIIKVALSLGLQLLLDLFSPSCVGFDH